MIELTAEQLNEMEVKEQKNIEFRDKLIKLINEYGLENVTNTPDYIIADQMIYAYLDMNELNRARDNWYCVHLEPANKYFEKEGN